VTSATALWSFMALTFAPTPARRQPATEHGSLARR
jgi:hypothetical protein